MKLLYFLNISDYFFTIFLVGTGFFIEANALMVGFVEKPMKGFILKIIFIGLLILLVSKIFKKATSKELKNINYILCFSLFIYIGINMLHIGYLAYYIYIK
ncbi:DUF5658 family protein [uncultured Clostridium sp.]|uniref:DUF5658 family protein n=1 Tax=uncultured Clostridium sp. TaxID=59620 RepID=UPI00344F6F6B